LFSICVRVIYRRFPELIGPRGVIPWVLLAIYVILNGALTAFGRLDYGIAQGASSRYRSMTFPFWVALAVISLLLYHRTQQQGHGRAVRFAGTAAAAICVVVYGLFYQQGVKTMRMRSRMLRQGFSAMLDYRNAPDEALEPLYPDASRVRMLSREMEGYRIGPFAR
jgi:hypothetical protein